jgi:hypothetical protein
MDTVPVWVNRLTRLGRLTNGTRLHLCANDRFWRIVLKKSKIERRQNLAMVEF